MKQKRGRVSAAALMVAAPVPLDTVPRQPPPHDLNDEECEVWVKVVNDLPADWFSPATVPLLAQYCRHVIQAKRIAELIERATGDPDLSVIAYELLLRMQGRESRTIAALATKMRISQQATTNHRGNKQTPTKRKPWES